MTAGNKRALGAQDLWRASHGFWTVWTVHLGRRFRLLHALDSVRRPLTAREIARKSKSDPRAVALWCDAAAALGIVEKHGSRFSMPRALVPLLLDADSPAYFGGHFSYLALRSLDFEAFDELFRDGAVSARRQRHLMEAFSEATRFDHTAFLEIVLPRAAPLRRALREGCEVLDVGAGSGTWEFRVAPRFPASTFVGLEPDGTALRLAEVEAARRGLGGRVHFVLSDAESMKFEGRFDVVYLGEVLCVARNPDLVLSKCRRALRTGGLLVVCEGLVDEAKPPTDPDNRIVVPMQLEFALQPARFLGKRELGRRLRAARFDNVTLVPAGGGLWFAVARAR